MSWSATQYSKFENERNRPIHDLLAQLPEIQVQAVADIGCGPGNSTEFLAQRYPQASVYGMDSSQNMIDAARKRLPHAHFEVADISTWHAQGSFDVILANAALQWLPDHQSLLPALLGKLAPGGSLAVQVPDNLDEPAHRLMREVAAEGPWSTRLAHAADARSSRHDALWYYQLLRGQGAQVNVWRTVYHHALEGGVHAIVEWFKGTGLRPFLDPLDESDREAYLARYEAALAKQYTVFDDGTVLLPFPRLFFVATVAA
ncbi:trans-aconitate 2-methyltransferase [Dyella sp.]|uniref:trans-aconitate 2-methyltransferase n=1 Tax=Dyella sp. TaxID=1869338 RepID=UPI002ED207C8